jgi:hypothetical protein
MIMVGMRRIVMAVALAAGSLATAGIAASVTATPSGATSPTCTDSWVGPSTGTTNWNAAATDWSAGFPGGSSVVCINAPGKYTVDLTAPDGTSINTLELGGGATGTQTLEVSGSSNDGLLSLGAASTVSRNGVLALAPTSTGYAQISGASSLTVGSGGVLSTVAGNSGSQPAYISVPVTNHAGGTVTIGAASTLQESDTLTTNAGTLTVASGADLALANSSSFTNTGSLAVAGTLSDDNGTFTESGGAETGNPVTFTGGESTLADSAGTGAFSFVTDGTLTGTIPSGQTVTVSGASTSVVVSLNSAVTDDGVLALAPTSAGYAQINGGSNNENLLTVGSGGVLSTVAGGAGSQSAYINSTVTNQAGGTITIGAAESYQDDDNLITNNGTLQVVNGGELTLTNGSILTNTGTLGVTVNGTSGTGGISGPGVTLEVGSTLAATTVGSPAVGTEFIPITGPVVGTFSAFSFGSHAYAVTYPSSAVELTTATPFTLKGGKKLTADEDLSAKETVAAFTAGSQSGATYTATINWGDGSSPTTGTVSSGKVSGSHVYTATGTYPVTVTLSDQFGTTETVTSSAVVTLPPAPTVTAVSPSTVVQNHSATLTLTGTEFTTDNSATVAFSAAGVTVSSVTWKSATELTVKVAIAKTATAGVGNVSVTTPGGTGTCTGCLTIDALPTIKSIAGGPLVPGATTTVTVKGTGFQTGLAVTTDIVGATVGTPSSVTATSFSVAITVPSGTSAGNDTLTVTNPDGGKVTSSKLVVS